MPNDTRKRTATSARVPSRASYEAKIRSRKSSDSVFMPPPYPPAAPCGYIIIENALDQAELEEGPNLYAYVEGNPINAVDPLGLADYPGSEYLQEEPRQVDCCESERYSALRAYDFNKECNKAQALADIECDTRLDYDYMKCSAARLGAAKVCNEAHARDESINQAVNALHRCFQKPCLSKRCDPPGPNRALPAEAALIRCHLFGEVCWSYVPCTV